MVATPAAAAISPLDPDLPAPVIALRGVDAGYGPVTILEELTLDISDGEIFCIIGGSGSGKSTLLKTIIGFTTIQRGQVFIDSEEVTGYSESKWGPVRTKMGMVFQQAALFDSLTVYENVAFPLMERYPKLGKKPVARRVFDLLDQLDMGGQEALFPNELSGGMRKRVGIARALIDHPKFLLYDEPTSGLDPITTAQVDGLILQARKQFGVTSVVVSHDMESVWRIADRIAVMLKRKLRAIGTPADIRESADPEVQDFIHGKLAESNPLAPILQEQEARRQAAR